MTSRPTPKMINMTRRTIICVRLVISALSLATFMGLGAVWTTVHLHLH